MSLPAPVSVVVRTVDRPEMLERCLRSILRCSPPPGDVLVVDQSAEGRSRAIVAGLGPPVRRLALAPPNRAAALNLGFEQAANDLVLVTDDDCTVDPGWIAAALAASAAAPGALITGRVRPVGDPRRVPSCRDDARPRDYSGELHHDKLYAGNMAAPRRAVLGAGGFDSRLETAEDNDLCLRWLAGHRRLRYEPRMVVDHHDWRDPDALRALYRSYARGQGALYAKHLRAGDLRVLRFLARDLLSVPRGALARALRRRPAWSDGRAQLLRGLPAGLLAGWRAPR